MRAYILMVLVAASVTYVLVGPVRLVAGRVGAITPVRDRDVHAQPVPRLGGLAMYGGLAAALLIASRLPLLGDIFARSRDAYGLLGGGAVICLLGAADDIWDIDWVTKLAGQVLAAGVMVSQGITLGWLPLGNWQGTVYLPYSVGVFLSVLVVLVMINAINFVDGLDGLAAGIVAIAAGAIFVFTYRLTVTAGIDRADTSSMVTAALVGLCIGFLPHNFNPARVFMGDSGASLLGLLLAAATINLTGRIEPTAMNSVGLGPALLPIALPVLVILVPLTDMMLAVVRRTRAGRSPFAPDKQHLHHRLLEIGHSHRRAVLIMYAWSGLVAFGVLVLSSYGGFWPKAGFTVVVLAALIATLGLDRRRWIRPGAGENRPVVP